MSGSFYDRVARKFGRSLTNLSHANRITEYPEGNPEAVFEQKIVELGGKDKVALDLGCGDGSFTLRMAPHFREVVGIDGSEERLKLAWEEQRERGVGNVRFEKQIAQHTNFPQNAFDVLYSRRGPTPFEECYRITKSGGYFLIISIGEKDAWRLKEIFGRGQGYHEWKSSALEQVVERLRRVGFEVLYGHDFLFDEYYASYQDLDLFLQGVPIFEDFDSEKDRKLLEVYVKQFQTDKGILLPRHRFVTVGEKV